MNTLQTQALTAIRSTAPARRAQIKGFKAPPVQAPIRRAWSAALQSCAFIGSMPMLCIHQLDDHRALITIDQKHPNATASLVMGEMPTLMVDLVTDQFRVFYISAADPESDSTDLDAVDDIGPQSLKLLPAFLMGLQMHGYVEAGVDILDSTLDTYRRFDIPL